MQLAIQLLPYVAAAISLIAFLIVSSGLSRTIAKLRSRMAKLEAQLQHNADFSAAIGELARRIQHLESEGPPGVQVPSAIPGSLNGTIRSKVLKMHRLGQPVDRIADNLRVPKGEVDLLVKVHQIVMRPYEQAPQGGEAEAS